MHSVLNYSEHHGEELAWLSFWSVEKSNSVPHVCTILNSHVWAISNSIINWHQITKLNQHQINVGICLDKILMCAYIFPTTSHFLQMFVISLMSDPVALLNSDVADVRS